MAWMNHMRQPRQHLSVFLKWGALGILMGALGGLLGAVFHHALHAVTHLRLENTWLIFLLPIGGLCRSVRYPADRLPVYHGI